MIWKIIALGEAGIIIILVTVLIVDRGQNKFIPTGSGPYIMVNSRTGEACFAGPKTSSELRPLPGFEPLPGAQEQQEPRKLPNGLPYCVDMK